ncbi:UNVERIFIED_CONTAM: hypothetical protein GTU68_023638 [Idotea baltica]|nr:hypothetical protein [Idotea baltica]
MIACAPAMWRKPHQRLPSCPRCVQRWSTFSAVLRNARAGRFWMVAISAPSFAQKPTQSYS